MIEYDCWCGQPTKFASAGVCRWGWVHIYVCPKHGRFEVVDSPLQRRGDQIR